MAANEQTIRVLTHPGSPVEISERPTSMLAIPATSSKIIPKAFAIQSECGDVLGNDFLRMTGDVVMGMTADEIPARFLARLGLFLARFCTSAWIGAASLFVVVGVIEVTRSGFDSATKDALVAIRFPAFYVFGAALVSLSWIGVWLAGNSASFSSGRRIGSLILLAIVLLLMAVDYVWIYQPLLQMVTPPGEAKPANFGSYHQASKWINLAGLSLCLTTALLVNWPANKAIADNNEVSNTLD